jgi:hypothetical protein
MTARLIGCNFRKVEKMRTIRRDGTPEIQEAVKNDKLRINSAYNKIRKMKQVQEDTGENSSAAQIKPLRITFSRESLALLQELGGDVGVHVNTALEVYKTLAAGWRAPRMTRNRGQEFPRRRRGAVKSRQDFGGAATSLFLRRFLAPR